MFLKRENVKSKLITLISCYIYFYIIVFLLFFRFWLFWKRSRSSRSSVLNGQCRKATCQYYENIKACIANILFIFFNAIVIKIFEAAFYGKHKFHFISVVHYYEWYLFSHCDILILIKSTRLCHRESKT